MTKHPVLGALAIAIVLSLVAAAAMLAIYPAQQVPWALALVLLAFPFAWFFAWLLLNGLAWWRDTMEPGRDP